MILRSLQDCFFVPLGLRSVVICLCVVPVMVISATGNLISSGQFLKSQQCIKLVTTGGSGAFATSPLSFSFPFLSPSICHHVKVGGDNFWSSTRARWSCEYDKTLTWNSMWLLSVKFLFSSNNLGLFQPFQPWTLSISTILTIYIETHLFHKSFLSDIISFSVLNLIFFCVFGYMWLIKMAIHQLFSAR